MYLLLYIIPILLIIMAQTMVSSAYSKYRTIHSSKGYTGEMVARQILQKNGLKNIVDVKLSEGGQFPDFYDPRLKSISLSNDVYYGSSISSISVAAHEAAHAIQHANGSVFIYVRNKMLPFVSVTSQSGWVILILGLIGASRQLISVGILCLIMSTAFQLLTLPIELNASKEAMFQLETNNIILEEEAKEVYNMENAIAFIYVASLISGINYIYNLFSAMRKRKNRT